MIKSRLGAAGIGMVLLFAPAGVAVAIADDTSVEVTIRDGSQGGGQPAHPGRFNGAPADEAPASSRGANPGVPLGPGH